MNPEIPEIPETDEYVIDFTRDQLAERLRAMAEDLDGGDKVQRWQRAVLVQAADMLENEVNA